MLKCIKTQDLRLGMYLHKLGGSWVEHPFWRTSFLLENPEDLQRLLDSNVHEAWIDVAKGSDVEALAVPVSVHSSASPHAIEKAPRVVAKVSMDEELGRAVKIYTRSRHAVYSMFQEARLGKAVNCDQAGELVEEISASVLRNRDALIGLARLKSKDDYTYMHSVAVCALMISLARQLGLEDSQVREAGMAGLLHDIGKMAVPPLVLNKPGKLTESEFITIKRHPEQGYRLLLESNSIGDVALDVCLHHHEKVDGTGYPKRLKGDEISLFAKMGAVCDVYDAITSNRPYKNGWSPDESLRRMAQWRHGHFDESVFAAFVRGIGIYPVGTLLQLKSGQIGVVIEQQDTTPLKPKIKAFFSIKSNAYIPPKIVDIASPSCADEIVGPVEASDLGLMNVEAFWLGNAYRKTQQ